MENLVKTIVWYSIQNGGDGSASPDWYLTEEEADQDQENMDEGWGESCTGSVETYEGSDIHQEAMMRKQAKDTGVEYWDLYMANRK